MASTTTSTSTLSTSSVCWIQLATTNGILTCAKKKRSLSFIEDIVSREADGPIVPDPSLKITEEDEKDPFAVIHESEDVAASMINDDDREARYLNYWLTRTVTTTYTTFTATSSLGSVYCTPLGNTENPCPANG